MSHCMLTHHLSFITYYYLLSTVYSPLLPDAFFATCPESLTVLYCNHYAAIDTRSRR